MILFSIFFSFCRIIKPRKYYLPLSKMTERPSLKASKSILRNKQHNNIHFYNDVYVHITAVAMQILILHTLNLRHFL